MTFLFRPPGPRRPSRPGRRCRPQVEALEQRLLPSFTAAPDVPVGSMPSSVAVGDFNGDGRQDLATTNFTSGAGSSRLGSGAGGFTNAPDVAIDKIPDFVAVADFNGDGKLDLAVGNILGFLVSIRLGNGAGGFTNVPDVFVGLGP